MHGIDHPEVPDLAAVSAAVARLRDRSARPGTHLRCVEAVAKYLGNVLENPSVGKVGTIDLSTYYAGMVGREGGRKSV